MPRLEPFLPNSLVRSLARAGAPRALPYVAPIEASLLLADIAGYTALSERLEALGREGAEGVVAIVGELFRPAIAAIERWGGGVEAFTGDGVLAFFTGRTSARRAVAAAEVIRDTFGARQQVAVGGGATAIGVVLAVHHGRVETVHLGTGTTRHYMVRGRSIATLARLPEGASPGAIKVSAAARRRLALEPPARPRAARPARVRPALLSSYLAAPLVPLLGRFPGEHRRCAVLFIETRGNTRAHHRFFELLVLTLDRYDGLLLKAIPSERGTTWLCVMGFPAAHEDDVERAARIAIALRDGAPAGLALRGGIDQGPLVILEMGSRTRRSLDVIGDVVNTSARALASARWGEVLATGRAVDALAAIETVARGRRRLKGKADLTRLHALRGEASVVPRRRVMAPLVGRVEELAVLRAALADAKGGSGSAFGLAGPAGIGKSRLAGELAADARRLGFEVVEGRATAVGAGPLATVVEIVRQVLAIDAEGGPATIAERVAAAATRLGLPALDRHHLADLLGVRDPAAPPAHLTARLRHENTLIAVVALFEALAARAPRLLILEDVHWSDGPTRDVCRSLASRCGDLPLMLLLLYRPGFEPPAETREIAVRELDSSEMELLLGSLLGPRPSVSPAELRERAEGNPLFAEEIVRHLRDGQVGRKRTDPAEPLPPSLHALIAARLDRLDGRARRAAQIGAVAGRSFRAALLDGWRDLGDARVALTELEAHDIVQPRGESDREGALSYTFKHTLTQEVAYGTILHAHRRRIHRQIARRLETLLHDGGEDAPALLAHHWQQAGVATRARPLYLRAAERAIRTFAHEEAERLLLSYLALVTRPTRESVAVRNKLGSEVLRYRGKGDQAIEMHWLAFAESRAIRNRALESESWSGLGHVFHETGRLDEALAAYENALDIAQAIDDLGNVGTCLENIAVVHTELGNIETALKMHERGLSIHRALGRRSAEARALSNLAVLLQSQGQYGDADRLYREALAATREIGDRRVEGIVLSNLGKIHHEADRMEEARACYEQAHAILEEVGDRRFSAISLATLASLHDATGHYVEAVEQFDRAISVLRQVGDRRWEAVLQAHIGPSLVQVGRWQDAEQRYRDALAMARDVKDRQTEALALLSAATLGRRCHHDFDGAKALVDEAESIGRKIGDSALVARCLIERAHQLLATTLSPAAARLRLAELREALGALELQPDLRLKNDVAEVAAAVSDLEAGRALLAGESLGFVPEALRPGPA